MHRRSFLKTAATAGALATGGMLASPAISQRAAARALRLVPHADLANFDPICSTAYIARNPGRWSGTCSTAWTTGCSRNGWWNQIVSRPTI
jgi:TAT (twin-arginine translocation) pathway signal sequence